MLSKLTLLLKAAKTESQQPFNMQLTWNLEKLPLNNSLRITLLALHSTSQSHSSLSAGHKVLA
jgi:hypothetical protein